MEPRAKKQIFIVSIFVLIILIMAFAVYFFYFRPTPTCSDGIQNQKEEGTDCGGPCEACEVKNLKNINILWVKVLATQNQNYDLLARVENLNQNYGSGQFTYEFQLFDLNDNLVSTRQGFAFILPREEKYIMEQKVFAGQDVAKVKLYVSPISWERAKDYEPPEIQVMDKKFEIKNEYPIFAIASGIAKNSSYSTYEKIRITVVLFGANNEPVALNSVDIDRLAAGQERLFSIPWYFSFPTQVVRAEMEPQINIFK